MNKIITPEELKSWVDLGKKIDSDKINQIISQAQEVDLRDYMGFKLYFNVLGNLEDETYQDLLSGSTFQYDGIPLQHEGLKSMLANLFMARYVLQLNTNITPFGAVTKATQDSEPADRNSLKDIAQGHKEEASSKWEIIKLYLEVNKVQFPIHNTTKNTIVTGEKRLRFRKI